MLKNKWPIIYYSNKRLSSKKERKNTFCKYMKSIFMLLLYIAAFAYTWYRLVFGRSQQNACKTRN